jgi:hypothetical protein
MKVYALAVQRNHVEPYLRRRCNDLGVIRSDPPKRRAFSGVDGAQRGAESSRVTAFDFDDDERRPVQANGVDFTAGNANVAREHLITAFG